MAVSSAQVPIGASAELVIENGPNPQDVFIRNDDATNAAFLGKSDVAASTGYELLAAKEIVIELPAGAALYAIQGAGAATLHVLVGDDSGVTFGS